MYSTISNYFFGAPNTAEINPPAIPQPEGQHSDEYQVTHTIMELVKPYFLAPYEHGISVMGYNVPSFGYHIAQRTINGVDYTVQRFNHALAHSLRQGALAKDLFDYLATIPKDETTTEIHEFLDWVAEKKAQGPEFLAKLEMAASFQRSGRQSECSSTKNLRLYHSYELRDVKFFKQAAENSGASQIYFNAEEIDSLTKGILWSTYPLPDPTLSRREELTPDVRYFKAIFHSAHILDLRRLTSFDGNRIKKEFITELFGEQGLNLPEALRAGLINDLWERSGQYLEATGDRDLVLQRPLQDHFFIQTAHPELLVHAVDQVRQKAIKPL